jgi:hypothetical protein
MAVTRLWAAGEAVAVSVNASGRPTHLTWHAHSHSVQQVVQQWRVETGWWEEGGAVRRSYYALLTADGLLCVVYYDHTTDGWRLSKLYD